MTSKLGTYWAVMHRRAQDYDYFKRLQPSVFKIMDGGAPDYAWANANLPNSLIIARDWALSEQHSDMLKDPVGTGYRHAVEWSQHQKRLGFDRGKTLILGINEPQVWMPGVAEALRQYTITLCDNATELGLRVGAMQLSVGWPANTGPDTPPSWGAFAGVEDAIKRGNHALCLHEYWADNGPGENWGWWAGRALKCPWNVPIVIGECGVDMYVKAGGQVPHNQRGWQGRMDANRYARELAEYVGRMSADPRFVGCCVFASDFANREWFSFDVEPAYQAILATPIPQTTPATTHLPTVSSGTPATPSGPTATINVPAGANVRTGPGTSYSALGALPNGTVLQVVGKNQTGEWFHVLTDRGTGWVSATVVRAQNVAGVPVTKVDMPQPQPQGDKWQRSIEFVRRWEGGWADNPNDVGGATNKGITIGTYTRWREAHGQPAPTKDDLRNLTDAEANQIYFEWYWKASGSDKLAWPLCLAHFDTAVNAGTGRAQEMLSKSGGDFIAYMGHLISWYTRIDGFEHFGRAWIRRRAEILLEAAK